jgi:two-component system alkaline phosphatase synthesis response regulator PhoP
MTRKILIIEDEPTLARLLSYNLAQDGYEIHVKHHGSEGFQEAIQQSYDLIILDIMLPGMNGYEIITALRQNENFTPVIFLTARNAEEEVVQGLKSGAEDYLTKPFGVSELLARVSVVLRRGKPETTPIRHTESIENVIVFGNLRVYPDKYEAMLNRKSISLRPKEFEVLQYLVQRPGVVVTRDDLMNVVWGFDYFGGQRTVDVHVSSLRKKLEMDQQTVRIEAIRGVGYKLILQSN